MLAVAIRTPAAPSYPQASPAPGATPERRRTMRPMTAAAFAFLDEPFTSAYEAPAPVNVFTVAGFSRQETVASNVLAFLLDPNERHRFGTTFVDALLTLLDGAQTSTGEAFHAASARGSSEWSTATEVPTDRRTRIDVLLENDDLDIAIVIEGSLDAAVVNPFGSYVERASRSHGTVVAAVLSPSHHDRDAAPLGIRMLRYDDLFEAADAALYDVGPTAEPRSLELYAQFREAMSERITTMLIEQEQWRLDELWSAIEHHQDQVLDFFTAIDAVNTVLVARGTRLRRAARSARHRALVVARQCRRSRLGPQPRRARPRLRRLHHREGRHDRAARRLAAAHRHVRLPGDGVSAPQPSDAAMGPHPAWPAARRRRGCGRRAVHGARAAMGHGRAARLTARAITAEWSKIRSEADSASQATQCRAKQMPSRHRRFDVSNSIVRPYARAGSRGVALRTPGARRPSGRCAVHAT